MSREKFKKSKYNTDNRKRQNQALLDLLRNATDRKPAHDTGDRFKSFLDKFAPKTPWTTLTLKTRWNGEPIAENAQLPTDGSYRLGLTICKYTDGNYSLTSRTVEERTEKVNSTAEFTSVFNFVRGTFNMWTHFADDDDGAYHSSMFRELLEHEKLEWDVIQQKPQYSPKTTKIKFQRTKEGVKFGELSPEQKNRLQTRYSVLFPNDVKLKEEDDVNSAIMLIELKEMG